MTDLDTAHNTCQHPHHQQQSTQPTKGAQTMTAYHNRLQAGHYTITTETTTANEHEELTIADLKDQLAAKGLPVSGAKDELVARLNQADQAPDNDE